MELKRMTERIWYTPFEEERDRPSLAYIKGDRLALAVDAGHSREHVEEFYDALQREGLPLPDLTALTHWHWDHTFGMHAIHGLSIAGRQTDGYLREILADDPRTIQEKYLKLDPHIYAEYKGGPDQGGSPVKVVSADIVFDETMDIDLGGVTAKLMHAPSPHTDDSVLIYIPEEKALFLGDAEGGTYPDWVRSPAKAEELARFVDKLSFEQALIGHWHVMTKKELLEDLRS